MQCKSHPSNKFKHSVYQRQTWAGLRVAHPRPVTNTILAAIRTRRIAARSSLSPPTASFGARTKIGPSTVHCTVASNAVYKAAKYKMSIVMPY